MATIKIISEEKVKPSSPTPCHLRSLKLSLLDQLIPAPMVLYYPNYHGATHAQLLHMLHLLKHSLSHTLTHFYPLAGTVKDHLSLECNDHGAYYVTTKVNCYLFEFLDPPDLHLISGFLPCDPLFMAGTSVTNIQVNLFECGGIAIGLCISHQILDGAGLKAFLVSWAGKSAGAEKLTCPEFVASSLFLANDLWLRESSMALWGGAFKKGNSVTRRFVFEACAITKLKELAASSCNNGRIPTRVEAVSAFLWKSIKAASFRLNPSTRRPSMLTHIVNLRRRSTSHLLTPNSIGNLIWIAGASCNANKDVDLPALADKIRISISKIDGEYVNKLCGDRGAALMRKSLKEMADFGSKEEVDRLGFSSWCGFGCYDIDFGWGKPIWISSIGVSAKMFMNLVILVDSKHAGGIEAWVTLDQPEMDALENNQELLAFASVNSKLENVHVI